MITGSMTALITPFKNGAVDEKAYAAIIERQIEAGTQALIPAGTTAETPTLDNRERLLIVELAIDIVAGRIPVIAGTGSNSTRSSIAYQAHAKAHGADAGLVVTPYYNKPSQGGLLAHYHTIADTIDLPIYVYNIPGRSIVDVLPETLAKIAEHPNIVGIKDATGDISRVAQQKAAVQKEFVQLSGDDGTSLAFNRAGGQGAISVTSNLAPELCAKFQHACQAGDWDEAECVNDLLMPLHNALFAAPSPAPVKYGLSLLGLCEDDVRLPMISPPDSVKEQVRSAMEGCGLL